MYCYIYFLKQIIIKLFDIGFGYHPDISTPEQVLALHREGLGYANFMNGRMDITIIEHIDYEGEHTANGVRYRFFRAKKGFFHLYRQTIRFIKKEQPDILYVQGLLFPFQVIALRLLLGKKYKIIVQHHAELPFSGIKKIFQRFADKYINAYVFTALGNAEPWIMNRIIKEKNKIIELLEGSTDFVQQEKSAGRKNLDINGYPVLLWVGNLVSGKDPMTVLTGFNKYLQHNPGARLYMIYRKTELLSKVKAHIAAHELLQKAVLLVGEVNHEALEQWFSAADFYISGSHKEGSGFALIEAMACGCIPVVTAIPSFKKITNDGALGFLFEPGNTDDLYNALLKTSQTDIGKYSDQVSHYFKTTLTFDAIAKQLHEHCTNLMTK